MPRAGNRSKPRRIDRCTSGILVAVFVSAVNATPACAGGGDTCQTAAIVSALPFADDGTCGFTNDYDDACPYEAAVPDVVYVFTPTRNMNLTASLCRNSNFDPKLFVYKGDCASTPVACGEDSCSSLVRAIPHRSRVLHRD